MAKQDIIGGRVFQLPVDDINLAGIVRPLWDAKLWIALSALLFMLAGGYYTFWVMTPQYRATSVIEFTPAQSGSFDLTSVLSQSSLNQSEINTRLNKLRSRELIEELVRVEDLTTIPELNPLLVAPSWFSLAGLWAVLGSSDVEAKRQAQNSRQTVGTIRSNVAVENPRDTYLFNLSFSSQDPQLAARIVNRLAEIYIAAEARENFEAGEQSIVWISEKVNLLEEEIRERESRISAFNAQSEVLSRETLEGINVQLKTFRERLAERKIALDTDRALLTQQQAAVDSRDVQQILTVFPDATLRRLAQSLTNDMTGPAQSVAAFQAQLDRLMSSTQARINQGEREQVSVSNSLESLQANYDTQSRELQTLTQMERELAVSRDLYQTMLTGLQETTVQVGLVPAEARLMSSALPPIVPYSPRPLFNLAVSLVLGVMLGMLLVWGAHRLLGGVKTTSRLEYATGVTVTGEVPKMPVSARKDLVNYLVSNSTSAVSEAIRNLRTSILMSSEEGQAPQVIMITSSIPGEGKTTLSICLAANIAALGKRVIIVEGDFRRRTLDEYFEFSEGGSHDVLNGTRTLEEVVYHDPRLGLDVLRGQSKGGENAADVLSSLVFAQLLAKLRTRYDYVILDTPPVLIVSDARILAREVDYILYAAKWNMTREDTIKAGLKMFETIGSPVSGLALTQIDVKRAQTYYGRGYEKGQYYDKDD